MREIFSLQHVVDLWIAGLLTTALLIQGARAEWFASTTSWRFSPGWQREIACFDLALALLLLQIRDSDAWIESIALGPLLLLFVLLGANHVAGLIRAPNKPGHWAGAGANAIAVGSALLALGLRT